MPNSEMPIDAHIQDSMTNLAESGHVKVIDLGNGKVLKEIVVMDEFDNTGFQGERLFEKRTNDAMTWIEGRLTRQQVAKESIPTGIKAPSEVFFIAKGSEGFPAPFCIQEKVDGTMLKDVNFETLDTLQRQQLKALLLANRKCFLTSGKCLDLVGGLNSDAPSFGRRLTKFFRPMENSANLFLTNAGDIALVDLDVIGSPLGSQVLKFMSLELAYWKTVVDESAKTLAGKLTG